MKLRYAQGDRDGPLEAKLRVQLEGLLQDRSADGSLIVAIRGTQLLGVFEVAVTDTCSLEYLGDLPAREAFVSRLVWAQDDWRDVPGALVKAKDLVLARFGVTLQWRFSRKKALWEKLRWVAQEAGMTLFQEKRVYTWDQRQPAREEPVLYRYANINEVGEKSYRELVTASGEGTLDRNDRWYRARAGATNWGHVLMSYYAPRHANTWMIAHDKQEQPVGLIAISSLGEPEMATIIYVGVLPSHRGRGVIDDLLRSGVRSARHNGFSRMLSDADVENLPMCAAFERNGHLTDGVPILKWHYRF